VALEPNNGSANVRADAPIRVAFDRPVRQPSIATRFHVTPSIAGCDLAGAFAGRVIGRTGCQIRWVRGGTAFVVEHEKAPFAADTKYVFQLDAGFVDTGGVANVLDHRWELATRTAPKVSGIVPTDGSSDVPIDASIVVTFNSYMRADSVNRSVALDPSVPGTRVLRNTEDRGRFILKPGRLLEPGRVYTVRVGRGAVEEHGLGLGASAQASFRAGGLSRSAHALVVAGAEGEPPTRAVMTALTTRAPKEPVAGATVFEAPRCLADACGGVRRGMPLIGIAEAALSPSARFLALSLTDQTTNPEEARLVIRPLEGGPDVTVTHRARHLSWSADSTRLAYSASDGVHIVGISNLADGTLPSGRPLSAPPIWAAGGADLILPLAERPLSDTTIGIDLADTALRLRYPLPTLGGVLSAPALTTDGSTLAVRRDGDPATAGTWTVALSGSGDGRPARLGTDLTPLAWAGNGTLVASALSRGTPALVRVNVATGDRSSLGGPHGADVATLVATASGRQLAYLQADAHSVTQALAENSDGTNVMALTDFGSDGLEALSVSIAG